MLTLVCIAGIVLGLIHRERAEKPITVMMVSLGVIVLIGWMDFVVEQVLYGAFGGTRGGGGIISRFNDVWNAVAALLRAAATAGLVFAVLDGRGFELFKLPPADKK